MTVLFNDPLRFGTEALEGFAAAHDQVRLVHGGVVTTAPAPGRRVAVVTGGGSGHYPAFAGWVGPGMADGAACGNVFASPSASQIFSVATEAVETGGILLVFGNYAGDVLNFSDAADRLRRAGHDVRVVTVSDDVASHTEHAQRRGIAGDLVVIKLAGASAYRGDTLDLAEAVARRANERTRTLGVAFAGCTLPGADGALFEVPHGQMAVGLGIHGEPGLSVRPRGTADEVADLLVDGVVADLGDGARPGARCAVVLNGLGGTKYEELFVVFARVRARLESLGLELVSPVVGEHVTSLDMAGLSLTVTVLDDDLASLWDAPCDSPAFRRGAVTAGHATRRVATSDAPTGGSSPAAAADPVAPGPGADPAARAAATRAVAALEAMARRAREAEAELGALDAVAGDGDHGRGMVLGSTAAHRAAEHAARRDGGASAVLTAAGDAWAEHAGGTSGALWGLILRSVAAALDDAQPPSGADLVRGLSDAAQAVQERGRARPGDKTLVDALVPFARTLAREHAAGSSLAGAWAAAARAATTAAEQTASIPARLGRARTHGDASLGHPDPGAVSLALLATAVAGVLAAPTTLEGARP